MIHIEAYEALRAENQALREALERAQEGLERARQETAETRERLLALEHELAQLKRLIFGTKSERFVPSDGADQLPLFAAMPAAQEESPALRESVSSGDGAPPRVARRKAVRQVLPSHLPREVIVTKGRTGTSPA